MLRRVAVRLPLTSCRLGSLHTPIQIGDAAFSSITLARLSLNPCTGFLVYYHRPYEMATTCRRPQLLFARSGNLEARDLPPRNLHTLVSSFLGSQVSHHFDLLLPSASRDPIYARELLADSLLQDSNNDAS